jgi:hypothetical protein
MMRIICEAQKRFVISWRRSGKVGGGGEKRDKSFYNILCEGENMCVV